MAKKQKFEGDSYSWFDSLKRKIRDKAYDVSCWLHSKTQRNKSPNEKKKRKGNLQRNIFLACVLTIPIMNFLIYYVVVNFNSILMAFQTYDMTTGKYVFLSGKQGLFKNFKDFIDALGGFECSFMTKNSFMLYFVSLFISMPVQIFTSFFIYKKIPGTKFFKVMLYLPQILSTIVMTILFRVFADQVIPNLLVMMGFMEKAPNFFAEENLFTTIIVYNVWFGMGGGLIIYTGAMSRIPDELVEYGMLEGMSMLKEFFYVTLPLIFPTLSVFLITGIAGIFTNQGNIYTFEGESAPATLWTYGYYMFVQVVGNNASLSKYPYASAAGLLFTFIAAPITLLVKYLLEKYGPEAEF